MAELADEILAARVQKPVVAIANSLAASAAYWVGCSASEFYVTPGGEVGSIGVWQAHFDYSQALAAFIRVAYRQGLRCVRVVYGKGLGSPGKMLVLKGKVQSWLVHKNEVLGSSCRPARRMVVQGRWWCCSGPRNRCGHPLPRACGLNRAESPSS